MLFLKRTHHIRLATGDELIPSNWRSICPSCDQQGECHVTSNRDCIIMVELTKMASGCSHLNSHLCYVRQNLYSSKQCSLTLLLGLGLSRLQRSQQVHQLLRSLSLMCRSFHSRHQRRGGEKWSRPHLMLKSTLNPKKILK